ncbi:hypothetical protein B4109_2410 [Geobacillus stearothermophilus]|uniref:Uncharacterized protein n=1 Tax=Geobacillus stearothermophilus TaxID=1422 RepID=A0A150MA91_GEOSE|nr:hypothetical protein B4109_2410 [Geobacillus stearothermophilus]
MDEVSLLSFSGYSRKEPGEEKRKSGRARRACHCRSFSQYNKDDYFGKIQNVRNHQIHIQERGRGE